LQRGERSFRPIGEAEQPGFDGGRDLRYVELLRLLVCWKMHFGQV
jgi:hypothetical protein